MMKRLAGALLLSLSLAAQADDAKMDAAAFVAHANETLEALTIEATRAAWIQANFITYDSQIIAAEASKKLTIEAVKLAMKAAEYDDAEVSADVRRQLDMLKGALTLPAPNDEAKAAELSTLASSLEAKYGSGKYCREDGTCFSLGDMVTEMANSRDEALLREFWEGWRTVSPPMRAEYARLVEIANEGSAGLGYTDTGALWRSKYDMPADDFAKEMDRLWGQVEPLYEALHCHVRAELNAQYGDEVVAMDQPIPAHLLGNMWAQQWGNIYPLVAPEDSDSGVDLTREINDANMTELDMVRSGEDFFSSLGFEELPETFWKRSLFTKPADRDVVCHASAWDVDQVDDLRIKMCIKKNAEDFVTIHHELGHNYYQRAYNQQPFVYKNSANDGFHEAIGDTVALSITPKYLKQIGLIEDVPPASGDIGLLMQQALDKIAFLPFGLLVDKWRWDVFSGDTPVEDYNKDWWKLRTKYQGIAAPVGRTEDNFDPGAKYHIPGNTPYSRYFLAHILQFQFHKALCEIAGDEGPLHRCSIYGSKEAGERLNKMLTMGSAKPWPDALEVVTGTREMDASPILEYFAPLQAWLDEQNQGRVCGW